MKTEYELKEVQNESQDAEELNKHYGVTE